MSGRTMSRYQQQRSEGKTEASREQFAGGSALVTYRDGSVLILETRSAKTAVLREANPVDYNDPPPANARRKRKL